MTRILFYTKDAREILRYTSLNLQKAGSIWMEAWAHKSDIETFKLNGWWYEPI